VTILVLMTLVFFSITRAYSLAYDRRREQLGEQWLESARQDMAQNRASTAVESFRTALVYLPQSWECRLGLAEALLRAGQTRQAEQYFESLWQIQPQNGRVNLALARLASLSKNSEEAQRYYNGAIFGDWPDRPEENRRQAAFELIEFYLQRNDKRHAESQLITVSASLPDEPWLQTRVGNFFAATGDFPRALDHFKRAARQQPDNLQALLGAAHSAFELGDFLMAESYAARALQVDGSSTDASQLRDLAQSILQLDPWERGLTSAEKARRALRSYQIAGDRLAACGHNVTESAEPAVSPLASSLEKWRKWKPNANLSALLRDPDLADELFDSSLQFEQSTQALCGRTSLQDEALLALARKRSAQDK
jgi:tetratricopeptide (TPR) repeat protein